MCMHPAAAHTPQDILGVPSYDELLRIPTAVALLPQDNPASQALQQILMKVRLAGCVRVCATICWRPCPCLYIHVARSHPPMISYAITLCHLMSDGIGIRSWHWFIHLTNSTTCSACWHRFSQPSYICAQVCILPPACGCVIQRRHTTHHSSAPA